MALCNGRRSGRLRFGAGYRRRDMAAPVNDVLRWMDRTDLSEAEIVYDPDLNRALDPYPIYLPARLHLCRRPMQNHHRLLGAHR